MRRDQKIAPKKALELGTHFGISGAYTASGLDEQGHLITVEAEKPKTKIASETFSELNLSNKVTIKNELFQDVLFQENSDISFKLAYHDGQHNKESTLKYFDELYRIAEPNSIIVFDDVITHSEEMAEAWNHICGDERVDLTISTNRFGIVLIKSAVDSKHEFSVWY